MSTPSDGQNGAVPPEAAADSTDAAEVSSEASPQPVASPEQLYQEALARLAAITEQWQQAREAFLRG